jgi:hypothetical protein
MQSPKAAVVDCFRNFRRDEAFCVPARDGSRLFTIPPLLQLARAAGSSCCWDYEDVSQCNAVWLAKTHVPASGDTEILQRFRIVNKIRARKYDHRSYELASQGEQFGYTCAGRGGFGKRPSLRTGRTIRIACVPP